MPKHSEFNSCYALLPSIPPQVGEAQREQRSIPLNVSPSRLRGRTVKFYPRSPPQAGEVNPFPPACGGNKKGGQFFPCENLTALRLQGEQGAVQHE